jgi:gluconate 2-dehydrogenase gamma chain
MSDEVFFSAHQRATIEAAMARIIPSDDLPGAREAAAVDFVDRYLSGIAFIYAKPDGSGFETLTGRQADAWRQRIAILRQTYASGIGALDALAQKLFQANFIALNERQQDDTLTAFDRSGAQSASAGGAPGEGPALQQTLTETELEFLPLLVMHTRQGFYADPIYGGNKDRAGWRAIGFPGPASLMEVYTGRYSALQWFAQGEAEKYLEANRDA